MTPAIAHVDVRRADGRAHTRLSGEVDLSNVSQVEQEIAEAVAGTRAVVLDLTPVEYMDSQGVRLLHALADRLDREGVEIVLVAPRRSIAGELLALTGLDDVVDVRESLDG